MPGILISEITMLQSLKLEFKYSNAAKGSVKADTLYPYFCRDSLIDVTMSNSSSTAAADLEYYGSIMEALSRT
jgi:hypothetical protein